VDANASRYFSIAISFLGNETKNFLRFISETAAVLASLVFNSIASNLAFDNYMVFTRVANFYVSAPLLSFSLNIYRGFFKD